ncbi:AlbA family DNA-binding domain-containing protein [Glutamicibacter ardleyensis]|uniref:AlbA family DNA-binding domain-containing protein n=1 Tax=Glutamicibacter ardleyensis TaxID=225894 RepID=UPI003FD32596
MPRTPLHAALGETGTELTFSLIEQAVADGVEERTDLDWKSDLPLTAIPKEGREAQSMELAKDIAAMANSGGGMIVYGIKEQAGSTSAAGEIKPVGPIGEDVLKTIRQVANNRIYPPVTSLHLIPVAPSEHPENGVLAALVTPSLDTPHLVHPKGSQDDKGWFQAPWRHGADTFHMNERQLADAYRRREERRHEKDQDFEKLYGNFLKTLGTTTIGSPSWVVGVAQPIQPLENARRLSGISASRFLDAAMKNYFPSQGISAFSELGFANADPKRGLRHFHFTTKRSLGEGRVQARVEIHGNGSLAIAFTRDGATGANIRHPNFVPIDDIQNLAKDLIALILQATESHTVLSDYRLRVNVAPTTQAFLRPDPHLVGHYQPFEEEHRIHNHQPIDATIVTQYGRHQLLQSAAELLEDINAQFGYHTSPTAAELEREITLND